MERFLRPEFLALMIPILAVAGAFTLLVARVWARHRERMAMIEQGMHPDRPQLDEGDVDLELELDLQERDADRVER